jgi:hypothetical protein
MLCRWRFRTGSGSSFGSLPQSNNSTNRIVTSLLFWFSLTLVSCAEPNNR